MPEPSDIDVIQLESRLRAIYSDLRTADMNQLYYEGRVKYLDRWRLLFEILIAVTATSSPIAGWALWKDDDYKAVWAIFAGLGAVISVISPLLRLTDKVKAASELKIGYCLLFFDLQEIARNADANHALVDADVELYKTSQKRMKELTTKDSSNPSAATKKELQERVNRRIPPDTLWMPQKDKDKDNGKDKGVKH